MRRILPVLAVLFALRLGSAATSPIVTTTSPDTPTAGATCTNLPPAPISRWKIDDSTGRTLHCTGGVWRYEDLRACTPDPPSSCTGLETCLSTAGSTPAIYACKSGSMFAIGATSGTPGGSPGQLQSNGGGGFAGVAGSSVDNAAGTVDVKVLQGDRLLSRYATSGNGLTLATCWSGFEASLFSSGPRRVYMPNGYVCWNSAVTIAPASANDREPSFELVGAGTGATRVIFGASGSLTVTGASTSGAYGVRIGGFSVGLAADHAYGSAIFQLVNAINYDVHDLLVYGGSKLGSGNEYQSYAANLISLDASYTGTIRNVFGYSRYMTMFEEDDIVATSEDDTIHFENIFWKGPLMGAIRFHSVGAHNLLFTNVKYQVPIELARDTNHYEVTTLAASASAAATSLQTQAGGASQFQVNDPVLIDVGDKLEVNKVSAVPDSSHITLAFGLRFSHGTSAQVLHGGVGIGLSGNSRIATFKSAMFEQCAIAVMFDETKFLHIEDTLSSCTELVGVVGPSPTGTTTGLWHATLENVELGRVPVADTMYGIRVHASADSANVRNIEIKHLEKNSSSDDTLVEYQNDSGNARSYWLQKVVGGALTQERYYQSGFGAPLDTATVGSTIVYQLNQNGQGFFRGGLLFGPIGSATTLGTLATTPRTNNMPDNSGTVCVTDGVSAFPSGCGGGGSGSGEANVTADTGGGLSIRATVPKIGVALNLRSLSATFFTQSGDLISPVAAALSTPGYVSAIDQVFSGLKHFPDGLDVPRNATTGGQLKLYEGADDFGDGVADDYILKVPDTGLNSGGYTCTLQADGRIPDACVGDGTDGGGSPTTTKGDLIVRGASNDARLPVGTNGQVLMADSAQTLGVKYADTVNVTVTSPADGDGAFWDGALSPPGFANKPFSGDFTCLKTGVCSVAAGVTKNASSQTLTNKDIRTRTADGNVIRLKSVDFLPVEWCIDGGTAPSSATTTTSTNKIRTRDFSGTADQDLQCPWMVPFDIGPTTTVTFRVIAFVTNSTAPANTEVVAFSLAGASVANSELLSSSLGTAVTSSLTADATYAQYDRLATTFSSAVTVTGIAGGETALLKLIRLATTTDTYAQAIGVAGIEIKYERTLNDD